MDRQKIEDGYFYILRKSIFLIGVLLILFGFIFNTFFFEKYVSIDGKLEFSTKKLIFSFQIFCFFLGGLLFFFERKMQKLNEKVKNVVINISFLAGSVFVVLLFMEGWMRVFILNQETFSIAGSDPGVFQDSDIIPWELKPNASDRFVALDFDTEVSINSLGLRGIERSVDKKNNLIRILVLGDSMTYGFGVENNETYSAVLESLLNERFIDANQEFEVWNAGFTSGYSPDTFYLYLREKGMKFNPDVVIVGLFVENDVVDLWKNRPVFDNKGTIIKIVSDFYRVENNRLRRGLVVDVRPSQFQKMQFYVKVLLLKYSKLYSYFNQKFSLFFIKENNPIFDKNYSEKIIKNFELVDFYLGEIKKLTQQHNNKLVVVFLPGKASVAIMWDGYLKKNPDSSREKSLVMLQASCKKYGIDCINMWPAFMSLNNTESLFFEHDGHWNMNGQQYAAEFIKDFLIDQKIVE